eukprot:scaffold149168_cov33-Tisochrysis_lutea.AAC.4
MLNSDCMTNLMMEAVWIHAAPCVGLSGMQQHSAMCTVVMVENSVTYGCPVRVSNNALQAYRGGCKSAIEQPELKRCRARKDAEGDP